VATRVSELAHQCHELELQPAADKGTDSALPSATLSIRITPPHCVSASPARMAQTHGNFFRQSCRISLSTVKKPPLAPNARSLTAR
jgi:hypothetical protein